ncbi:TonB-dependent receptor [Sphingopyxis sp. Q841]|uniref:TonB-dependent receptor n=1 Tax=Sphingopyxis sp. Q841 TaxID=3458250 RepID=UPI00403629D5
MSRYIGLFVSVSLLAFSAPAFAQTEEGVAAAPSDTADDGEAIVVTALKRSSSLQDTPATIQAIEPEQLANAQISELTNLGRVVPSMQIYTSPLGNPSLFLYGMGTSATGTTFEQSVMPFFNGVANGHGRSLLVGTYDLSSIEVVKGTQAILGKNASLGAVMVNTQLPRGEFAASLTGRYEFNLNSPYIEGMVNIPVSDTLSVRFAGQWKNDKGWVRNSFLGRDEPRTKSYSLRASLLWEPSDNFSYSLVYQHDQRHQRGVSFESVGFTPSAGNGQALCALAGITCDFTLNFENQQNPGTRFGSTRDYQEGDRVIGTGTLDLGGLTLTAISGFIRYEVDSVVDVDQMPLPLFTANLRESDTLYSQELRLASAEDQRFRWLIGAYVGHDRFALPITSITSPVIVSGGTTLWAINGSVDFAYSQRATTLSAFAQGSYDITDSLELTGGLRYTDETKKAVIGNTTITPGLYSNVLQPPFPLTKVSRHDATPDYGVSLKYEANPDLTLYVSYGQGTKSGGFNNQPKPGATYQTFRDNAEYQEETARTIEAGVKYSLGRAGYVNLSAFRVKVSDFQNSTSVGPLLVYLSRNQRSRGGTLDALIRPIPDLSLRAQVTYADTHDTTANLPLTYAPKWSGIVGADYKGDLGGLKLGAGMELEFRSSQYNRQPSSPTPPPTEFIYNFGSAQRLNARVSLATDDDRYEIALLGRNLTNERIVDSAYGGTGFSGIGASYERPRTIAVQVTARY